MGRHSPARRGVRRWGWPAPLLCVLVWAGLLGGSGGACSESFCEDGWYAATLYLEASEERTPDAIPRATTRLCTDRALLLEEEREVALRGSARAPAYILTVPTPPPLALRRSGPDGVRMFIVEYCGSEQCHTWFLRGTYGVEKALDTGGCGENRFCAWNLGLRDPDGTAQGELLGDLLHLDLDEAFVSEEGYCAGLPDSTT